MGHLTLEIQGVKFKNMKVWWYFIQAVMFIVICSISQSLLFSLAGTHTPALTLHLSRA